MEEKIRAVDRAEEQEQHELEELTDDKQAWDLAEKHERQNSLFLAGIRKEKRSQSTVLRPSLGSGHFHSTEESNIEEANEGEEESNQSLDNV